MDYILLRKIESVTVPACDALGYTFSSTCPLDFSATSIRAYIATYDHEKDMVVLTQKTKVPANTGVLIFSDSELTNQAIPTTTAATDDVTGNKLVAVSKAMTLTAAGDGNENYVLTIENAKPAFQKIDATSASMSAGQAYLQIPARTSSARSLRVVFEGETTGVNEELRMKNEESSFVNDWHNLAGQRVAQPTKGIYVNHGKKVIIK